MINAIKQNLKLGVTIQVAPQLIPTPRELSQKMAAMLNLKPTDKILEPEAGTGRLISACDEIWHDKGQMIAVENNYNLCESLKRNYPFAKIHCADFLSFTPEILGKFDKIIMNPPFANHQDVDHILHAFRFLKNDGELVSIVCEGPFFRQSKKSKGFRDFLDRYDAEIITLPNGTFKESGTMVNSRLIHIRKK